MYKKNKLKILFFLGILTPYVSNILFNRLWDFSFIILLPLFVISLIVLIFSTIKLTSNKRNIFNVKYWFISIFVVFIFFFSYRLQLNLSDYITYNISKEELNEFVTEINNFKKISIMSDEYENLNGYPINNWGLGKEYSLDSILNNYEVDKEKYELFRQELKSTGFRSFERIENGTIFFTKGGIIDNCYGIAYSNKEEHPVENHCGKIIYWKKICDNWYTWSTT